MAVSITLTGTNQNITATNGLPNITVANTTGWVVGATVQGTGWLAGTKIVSFVANTSAVFSNNYTGTTGATTVIVSSIYGSNLTIALSASGDVATWQNVFNAGFGALQGSHSLFHAGALTITFGSIVSGARFDHQDWTVEFGTGGRMLFDSGLLAGEQRGGYFQADSLLIKCDGPTFVFNNWNNSTAGGSSLFLNTGGLLTQGGLFRMHDVRFVARTGANMSPAFTSVRDLIDVENLIMDYEGDSGTNASIGLGFGTLLNPKIIKGNSGIARTNANSLGTITGLYYLGLFTATPSAKFAIPDGSTMDGYAPQLTSAQSFGGFQSGSTETYSNINLSTAGWGLSDILTKYFRFGGTNIINFSRRVSLEFNDSTGANLTNVTLYIKSGILNLINAVQAGDFSQNLNGLVLEWRNSLSSYRVATNVTNTINQIAQVRKYGFKEQVTSYSLNLASYSQPFFMLADTSLAGISSAAAALLTKIGVSFSEKVFSISSNSTLDEINARISYDLALTQNSIYSDPKLVDGVNIDFTGGTINVLAGTLSEGSFLKTLSATNLILPSVAPTSLFNASSVWTADGLWTPDMVWGNQQIFGTASAISCNVSISGSLKSVANQITGSVALTGTAIWETVSPQVLPSGSASATSKIKITSATANSIVNGSAYNFNAATVFENASGQNIILKLAPGQTQPTLLATSGTITIDASTPVNITAPNLITGSRVQVFNVTDGVELYNDVLSATGLTFPYSWVANKTIRLRATYQNALTAKLPLEASGVVTGSGLTFTNTQVDDSIYIANNINGSTVTGLSADFTNIVINVAQGTTRSLQQVYAWAVFNQTSAEGIRKFMNAITATDTVNYIMDQSIVNTKFNNTGATPVLFNGGVITRKDGSTVIAATSGSIQIDPAKAYLANGTEINTKIDLLQADIDQMMLDGHLTLDEYIGLK